MISPQILLLCTIYNLTPHVIVYTRCIYIIHFYFTYYIVLTYYKSLNPFKPQFAIVIFIHYELKWVANEKRILLLLKQFQENVRSETPMCRKLSHSSDLQNYVLMHHQGLKPSRAKDDVKPQFCCYLSMHSFAIVLKRCQVWKENDFSV